MTTSHSRGRSFWRRALKEKNKFDANIFLERVFPNWFGSAQYNLLIPNQERFPHRHINRLKKIDAVLCKSQHATEIFSKLGCNAHFTGFTSHDLLDETIEPDYQSFMHLAGRSTLKGTQTVLELWEKHPEWPPLTLIQCEENSPKSFPPNVKLITEYLSHEKIRKIINTHGIHLCPSLSEGWGHYIAEAMSAQALVVTTDAPPMNELVTAERGVLVPYQKSEPRHLGTNFYTDIQKLESTLAMLMRTPAEKKKHLGEKARAWFLENDKRFRSELAEIILNTH